METKPHNRRIFAGVYLEHATGKMIIVITVAKNIETGEDMVMCKNAKIYGKPEYFIVSKRFFCEMVIDDDGEWVDRYARQTCEYFSDDQIWNLESVGFEYPHRSRRNPPLDEYDTRKLREFESYYFYAKDLCVHYDTDRKKRDLCIAQNRYIGIDGKTKDERKAQFSALRADILFTERCFDTSLSEYKNFFTERFVNRLSIRKYADKYNMNRGSVVFLQEKMLKAFAAVLKARDDGDGIVRLKKTK